jgi:hypothetical protein
MRMVAALLFLTHVFHTSNSFGANKAPTGHAFSILRVRNEVNLQALPSDYVLVFAKQFLYQQEFQGYHSLATQLQHGSCSASELLDLANSSQVNKFKLKCQYHSHSTLVAALEPIHVTQQIVTCPLPSSHQHGLTVSLANQEQRVLPALPLPTANNAVVLHSRTPQYKLCACLMLWYRAEFLHEWLRFYSAIHGVGKTFIYDNNSTIDRLAETVSWLNTSFNLDYTWFPELHSQPAYTGHCLTRARAECEWVILFDIDEYASLSQAPRGQLAGFLDSLPPEVGLVKMIMGTYSAGYYPQLEQPAGSLVNNYQCRVLPVRNMLANIKSIVRSKAVHPSLYSTIHRICIDSAWREKTVYYSAGLLHHLKVFMQFASHARLVSLSLGME